VEARDDLAADSGAGRDESPHRFVPVCFKCLEPIRPAATLCATCGAPVSDCAMLLPFEGAIQEGRLLGEASRFRAPSIGIVIGVWLVTLPALGSFVLYASALLSPSWWEPQTSPILWAFGTVATLLWCALLVVVAVRTTLHWRRGHRTTSPAPPTLPA
jgi:hypothetical protein